MNAGDYILGAIEKVAKRLIRAREPVILEGEVKAIDPIKIKVNDYEITEEHCIFDIRCTEQWLRVPKASNYEHLHEIDAETEKATTGGVLNPGSGGATWTETGHTHKIKIETKTALPEICLWRGLKEGDKVRILRLEGGAVHWIIGRVEENIDNDSEEEGGEHGTT